MNKTTFLLILILLLASILRLAFLNNIPVATTYDQLYYILNAKSFLYTGTDLAGSINPLQLFIFHYPAGDIAQAELPFFLQFPLLSFLPLSLTIAALPNVLLSILTVLLLFLVGAKLFDKKTALIISTIAAINPWFVVIGRTFYEPVPATFFYLLGFYILLIARKWKILLAFPVFLLAFYSYIGTKLIFFPFLLISVIYCYFVTNKKQYGKQYLTLLSISLLLIIFFVLQLHQHSGNSRLSEIISPNNPAITDQVNNLRKVAIQSPFINIFINKFTIYLQILSTNFLNIFNPVYLFAQGDNFFSLYRHGLFYILDFFFLILGLLFLFAEKRKLFVFFIVTILVSTLPQIVHDPKAGGNFTPHISLLIPFFIILIGFGITHAAELFNKKIRFAVFFLIGIFYLISLINFLTVYVSQAPFNEDVFSFSPRVLSRYINFSEKNQQKILVYSASSEVTFKRFLFYNNAYTGQSASAINQSMKDKNLTYNRVSFLPCPHMIDIKNKTDLIIVDALCGLSQTGSFVSTAQLKDSGKTYNIFNDKICNQYNLQPYISHVKLSDLNVEKLDEKTLCEEFIIH